MMKKKREPRATKAEDWTPCTKLGKLVKDGKIKCIEEVYLHSLPIKVRSGAVFHVPC
jgi:small subunit ribosomal protein S2e